MFTTVDLLYRYCQISLWDNCKEKNTFIFLFVKYVLEIFSFRLMNYPYTFQRMIYQIFRDLSFVFVYLDDVVFSSRCLANHVNHLREVFLRLANHGIKVKVPKFYFTQAQVELVRHFISKEVMKVEPNKVRLIQVTAKPKKWDGDSQVFGNCGILSTRGMSAGFSSLEMLYGVKKRLITSDQAIGVVEHSMKVRKEKCCGSWSDGLRPLDDGSLDTPWDSFGEESFEGVKVESERDWRSCIQFVFCCVFYYFYFVMEIIILATLKLLLYSK